MSKLEHSIKGIKVEPCWDSMYHGVPCLESNKAFGFFKSRNDVRPSSCCWIKKYIDKTRQSTLKEFKEWK